MQVHDTPAQEAALRRTIFQLSLASFASMTIQRLCDPMLPVLARDFQVDLGQAAAVIGWFAVVYGMAQLFYGPMSDRFGKYRVIAACTLTSSLGCLGCALAVGLDQLVLARMLSAFTAAAIVPMGMAWVGDAVRYEVRQEQLARLGMGSTMGIFGGQVIGGICTDTIGWRWAFVFMSLGFLVVGVLLWRRQSQAGTLVPKALDAHAQAIPFHRKVMAVWAQPRARLVLSTVLLEGASAFGVVAMGVTHLHQQQGVSLSLAGLAISMFGIGCLSYAIVARHFIRRLGEPGMVHIGTLLFGLPFVFIAFVPDWRWAMLASGLSGFGFFMFHNTLQVMATQMHPPQRATCMTLFAGTLFTGQSLGVLLAAHWVDRWGSTWVIASGALIVVLMGQCIPALIKRTQPHTSSP
ncbi:MAG: MFS transporter [Alphaproteobacteria bacterium]|nr:MFS transporter [Alphaproteobacteria bacterium]